MKKSIKILTLVLSLALLCGALVVAAFASETTTEIVGVVLDNAADMEETLVTEIPTAESVDATNKVTAIDKDAGSAREVSFKHQLGGIPKFVTNPVDENTYLTVDWSDGSTSASGHFFDTYHKDGRWGVWKDEDKDSAPFYGSKIMYVVVDVDLMWEDPANYDGTGYFYPYLGYTTTSGGFTPIASSVGVRFVNSGDNVAAQLTQSNNSFVIGSSDSWSHVTLILGFEIVGEGDAQNVAIKQYLAVDGTIVDASEYVNDVDASTVVAGDKTRLYARDVRFNVFGKGKTSAWVDNFKVRSILPTYNGNLADVLAKGVGADLTAWESNVYNAATMPYGKTVAKIGDTPYDSLQKAINAASANDVITLCGNVSVATTVDKALTIDCGEYTCVKPSGATGIAVAPLSADGKYVAETYESGKMFIVWGACSCGLDTCDETHPGGDGAATYSNGDLYNTIYSAYAAYGKDANWTLSVGPDNYALVGFKDDAGNVYNENSIVTKEMYEIGYLVLTPVIEKSSNTVSYIKGGETIYTTSFAEAMANADADSTVTLLADTKYVPTETVGVSKNVTVNLNGHLLDMLNPTKMTAFKIGANKTFTVLGEEEGSALVYGYPKATNNAGGTLFGSGDGATITLKGENLKVSTAALYGVWDDVSVTINLEGVDLNHNGAGDNPYNIYISKEAGANCAYTINIKDSIINGLNAGIYCNNQQPSVVNIENSVILNQLLTNASANDNTTVNVKDSYIYGSLKNAKAINVSGENYFTSNDWIDKATFAEGYSLATNIVDVKHVNYTHPWVADDSTGTLVWDHEATNTFTEAEVARTYSYQSTNAPVTVKVYDGETLLNTVVSVAGGKFVAHTVAGVSVADGWVKQTSKYWYTVDAAATGEVSVDVADISDIAIVYEAGTPKLYANYTLSDNLTTHLYVPAELPEGIAIPDITLNGKNTGRGLSGNWTIGGVAYENTDGWPSAWGADEGVYWDITYTYEGNTFTYRVTVDVVNYANKVAEIYATDTEKLQQVTALLQYVEAANKIKEATISNGLSEALAALKEKVTLPAVATDYLADLTQIRSYISGVAVSINSSRGGSMLFTPVDATNTIKITAGETAIGTAVKDGAVAIDNNNLCNWAASDLTIQVLDAEGNVLGTGTYSLAAYYNEMASMATADQLALLEAMYALAVIGDTNK